MFYMAKFSVFLYIRMTKVNASRLKESSISLTFPQSATQTHCINGAMLVSSKAQEGTWQGVQINP